MALDVVAAERLAGAQRRLEVDRIAAGERTQGRPPQGLRNGVKRHGACSTDSAVRQTPLTATESPGWTRRHRRGRLDDETARRPRPLDSSAIRPTSRTIPVNMPQG